MYPFFRLARVLRAARRRPPLSVAATSRLNLICWPLDIDMFAEMNNGRVLTLYDLGRFDHAARTGLIKMLKPHGWGFAVGGASVRYRKRVRAFDRVTLTTTPRGRDARWFYLEQTMVVRGAPVSNGLMRTCVTDSTGIVPTERVMEALGEASWNPPLPRWITAWAEAEALRPWPPETPEDGAC